MKRIEASGDQDGKGKKTGKEPLSYSLYEDLCTRSLQLEDNGFAHLFLTTQWNLMCRSKSVETLHLDHFHAVDDSIGCVLHKTKTNQEGSGRKDPRHLYSKPNVATNLLDACISYLPGFISITSTCKVVSRVESKGTVR